MTSIFSSNLNTLNSTSTFGGTLFGSSLSGGNFGSTSGLFSGNTYGASSLFGSNVGLGGYGYFGNTFGGYNSTSWGNLGSTLGVSNGTTISRVTTTTTTTPATTLSGITIATVQTDEEEDYHFYNTDFIDADGNAAVSMQVVDLPDNGVLEIDGDEVRLNQIILADEFDNLDYVPDDYFDATDGFSVLLSTDGVNYDTTNSNVIINVLGENDTPTIASATTQTVTEGATATGLGNAIIDAFEDVDTGDTLGAVFITGIDNDDLGTLLYTTAAGGTVTITDDETRDDGYELTAAEAESLVFVANDNVIGDDASGEKVTIEFTMEDSNGGDSKDSDSGKTGSIAVQVHDGDDAPDFSNSDYNEIVAVEENDTAVGGVNPATDDESNGLLQYSITGTDASHFTVDQNNGALSFTDAPNFEDPQDYDGNNDYTFVLHARDESGNTASTTVNVAVKDITATADQWTLTATSATIQEGTTAAMTVVPQLADISNDITFAIGADGNNQNDLFEIDSNGVLSFIEAPDAENAETGVSGGVYKVDVVLTDEDETDSSGNPLSNKLVTVSITVDDIHDEDPALTSESAISEGSTENVDVVANAGSLSFAIDEDFVPDEAVSLLTLKFNNGESSALSGTPDLSFSLDSTADTDSSVDDFTVLSSASGSTVTATISIAKDAEFDFEQLDDDGEFQLTLTVTDNDDGRTAETVIDVQVLDVNEIPSFSADPEEISVGDLDSNGEIFGDEITSVVHDPEEQDLTYKIDSISDNYGLSYGFNGDGNWTRSVDTPVDGYQGPWASVTLADSDSIGFQIQYEIGNAYYPYVGGELSEAQMDNVRVVADYSGDHYVNMVSNPLISLVFQVDDDFSNSGNDAATALSDTYYIGVDVI